jgi:serine/threonine protein kinase
LTVFHLNSRDIFHRNIKPANFLIKKESNGKTYLYLTDFGIAKNIRYEGVRISTDISIVKGTEEYTPPEYFDSEFEKPDNLTVDIDADCSECHSFFYQRILRQFIFRTQKSSS